MTDLPIADVRSRRISPVWAIPLLCLGMVMFFVAQQWKDRGPLIVIHFPNADTLVPGKTEIKYLGVNVGKVTRVHVDTEKKSVDVEARLTRSIADLAREKTVFVVEKPEVSIAGVQGLTAIFSGSSLELRPGEGEPASEFKGYPDMRSLTRDLPGLTVVLTAPKASSLQAGDGVSYRGVRVGIVESTGFSSSGQLVRVSVKIEREYSHLVRTNTQFWDASGVRAKIGLFGAKINVDSMQTLLAGGIAFATPNEPGPQAHFGAEFSLLADIDPAWEKWSPKL